MKWTILPLCGAALLIGPVLADDQVKDAGSPVQPRYTYSQRASYDGIGKWHMGGHHDDPRPGFDHWISFAGQGHYYPVKRNGKTNTLNINGESVPQKGYITDELTDYALEWLSGRDSEEPFFLYLSHKAVHADFSPAKRHENQYADKTIPVPESQADTPENYAGKRTATRRSLRSTSRTCA